MQKNPFTIRGHLRRCWLFTWRAPVESIQRHLPSVLSPVTHGGFAFWNAVVCEVRDLRPAPLPGWCGLSYWHVGYRIYVRAPLAEGGEIEGLYFVRSDCDRRIVAWPGNVITDFRFRVGEIRVTQISPRTIGEVRVEGANVNFELDHQGTPSLNAGSPFATVHDAEAALKYPPASIGTAGLNHLNVVRIAREENAWRSSAIAAPRLDFEFFANEPVAPELCFEVDPIDYQWNRGELLEVAR
ncbi:MAG: DUF2071 domain-containing protein [Chthoniobacteraceae bacterium]